MNRLRRHSAWTLLVILLIGGLPVAHSLQHATEFMQGAADQAPAPAKETTANAVSLPGSDHVASHAITSERPSCVLCAHLLYGTPAPTQPPALLHDALSEEVRLRSRVASATPHGFLVRGPPVCA